MMIILSIPKINEQITSHRLQNTSPSLIRYSKRRKSQHPSVYEYIEKKKEKENETKKKVKIEMEKKDVEKNYGLVVLAPRRFR